MVLNTDFVRVARLIGVLIAAANLSACGGNGEGGGAGGASDVEAALAKTSPLGWRCKNVGKIEIATEEHDAYECEWGDVYVQERACYALADGQLYNVSSRSYQIVTRSGREARCIL